MRILGANLPVGGGGYFRIFPYAVTRWAIRRLNDREARPALIYLHPWELDEDQPRLRARRLARFRQYANIHRTRPRLHRLLDEFRFAPLIEAIREVRSDTVLDLAALQPASALAGIAPVAG